MSLWDHYTYCILYRVVSIDAWRNSFDRVEESLWKNKYTIKHVLTSRPRQHENNVTNRPRRKQLELIDVTYNF